MDYEELIEGLRDLYENYISEFCSDDTLNCDDLCDGRCKDCVLLQAITAIETLLEERDAAVEYIPKNCNTCRYWYDGGCVAPLELFGGCDFGVRQAWQWRGPTPTDREDDSPNPPENPQGG